MADNIQFELETVLSQVHVLKKYIGSSLKEWIQNNPKQGYSVEESIENSIKYSIQFEVEKGSETFKSLVAIAQKLGVTHPNSNNMNLTDGDTQTKRDGTPLAPGKWLIQAQSSYPIDVVDYNNNDLKLDTEPGNGTPAVVGLNINITNNGNVVYYPGAIMANPSEIKANSFGKFTFSRFAKKDTPLPTDNAASGFGSEQEGLEGF